MFEWENQFFEENYLKISTLFLDITWATLNLKTAVYFQLKHF